MLIRDEYLRLIGEAVASASRNTSQVLFVSGRSGTGKTTLIEHLEFPGPCLKVTTVAPDLSIPSYWLLTDFLDQVQSTGGAGEELNRLPGEFISLFLNRSLPDPEGGAEIYRHAFRRILATLTGQRPVVWIVEDLHWADNASLQVLGNLFQGGEQWPFILIATYSLDHLKHEHPIRKIRSGYRRLSCFKEIRLQPFSEEELHLYLRTKYGGSPDQGITGTILDHTDGLPLFVNELTDHLWKTGFLAKNGEGNLTLAQKENIPVPESIRDLVLIQMGDLSGEARDLAEIAASYHTEFELSFLEKFSTSPASIDELIDRGVIIEKSPGMGSFRHTLIGEMIREGIIWSKRKEIFGRIAAELEKADPSSSLLADFWYKSGNTKKSRPALVSLARESCRIFAYRDAAGWAEKALSEWPRGEDEAERVELLKEFAYCCRTSGDIENAIRAYRELLESPLAGFDAFERAEIFRELAVLYGLNGSWNLYYQAKQSAIDYFRDSGHAVELVIEEMELALSYFKELKYVESLSTINEAMSHVPEGSDILHAKALALKGYLDAISGNFEQGYQEAAEAVNLALKENDLQAISESYRRLAGTLEYASAFSKSAKAYEVALDFCESNGLVVEEAQCLSCMAWVFLRTGEWRKCFETARRVLDNPNSQNLSRCTASAILALMRAYRGELKTAGKNLADTIKLAAREGSILHQMIAVWPMSVLAMVKGEDQEAMKHFSRMIDLWFTTEDRHDSLPGLCDAVSFFTLHNMPKELNQCISALSRITRYTKNQEALAVLSFALGASLYLKGDNKEALVHFEKSIDYFRLVNTPVQESMVQFHLARVLYSLGRGSEAMEALGTAYQSFKRLGIRYWCSLIELEREAFAGSIANSGQSDEEHRQYQLTRRQLEILRMLTKGLSNKEIASQVSLSTRTVDMHVRNIFDRLNCRTRAEATRIALDHKVVD